MLPEWLVDRGEIASFVVIVLVLGVSTRVVGRLLGRPAGSVEDQWWWGGIAFLIAGRLGYVALATPELLLDVMVLIRFPDGVDPLVGAAAALAVVAWRGRGGGLAGIASAGVVAVVGLVLASTAYGLACPLREACFGATVSPPWGFPMHGLTEPRFATPLMESVLLLALLTLAVRQLGRWSVVRTGWALVAGLAVVRVAMMPISASGVDVPAAVVLGVIAGGGVLGWWRGWGDGAEDGSPGGSRSAAMPDGAS